MTTLNSYSVPLETGTVHLQTSATWGEVDALCAFGLRNNPKRGFLVVSRVLGRHLPATPLSMLRAWDALAAMLPRDLPAPILFVGMAETAVALGQGVRDTYVAQTRGRGDWDVPQPPPREDCLYIHTTRQRIPDASVLLRCTEPHSHAADHLLHQPLDPRDAMLMRTARTVVLVDDEITTGTTLANLEATLCGALPNIQRVERVCLTDWSNGAVESHALLRGSLRWEPNPAWIGQPLKVADSRFGTVMNHRNWGRLGISHWPEGCEEYAKNLSFPHDSRVLVLGAGEHVYPPYVVARKLEVAGYNVWCQALSRTPIIPGGCMAEGSLMMEDDYGSGADIYLHNPRACNPTHVIACRETLRGPPDVLVQQLGATGLYMGGGAA